MIYISNLRCLIIVFFAFSLTLSFYSSQNNNQIDKNSNLLIPSNYKSNNVRNVVKTLNAAEALIKTKGEKGLDIIREQNKISGELSVYVFSYEGESIIDFDSEAQNSKDHSQQFNIETAAIQYMLKEEVEDRDCGWVHYKWMQKGSFYPEWKSSLVTSAISPSGKKYILVCGDFNLPIEDEFIIEFVDDFTDLFLKDKYTYADFEKKSYRVFMHKTYIFVMNDEGVMIHNPVYPFLESRNLYDYKDYEGRYIFREMINSLSNSNETWIEYLVQTKEKPFKKRVYLRKVKKGNDIYIIAAGYILN